MCRLWWCCGVQAGRSSSDQRFETISDGGGEVLNFTVEETIEALPFVCGVVVESSESYVQAVKVLGRQDRVVGSDSGCYSDDCRFDWWSGIIGGFPLLPEFGILAMRVSDRPIEGAC